MRFRVTSIKPGYCEVWANRYDGGRYQKLALVMREGGMWSWSAKEEEPPFYMPFFTTQFRLRVDCIEDCERWALKRQMQRAIKQQPEESEHWCSPRRMALADMERSHLFGPDELDVWRERARTFGEVRA